MPETLTRSRRAARPGRTAAAALITTLAAAVVLSFLLAFTLMPGASGVSSTAHPTTDIVTTWEGTPRTGTPPTGPGTGTRTGTGDPDASTHAPARASTEAGDYRISFRCEGLSNDAPLGQEELCPVHVLDRHDAMAQPVLVVDPVRADRISFLALHGGRGPTLVPGDAPPSPQGRDNDVHQPHTTFRTADGGKAWQDMPFYAPPGLEDERVFGVDNAATLDGDDRLVLAALYAHAERGDGQVAGASPTTGPYAYALGLWKADRPGQPVDYAANVAVVQLTTPGDGLVVSQLHAAVVTASGTTLVLFHQRDGPDARQGTVRALATVDGRGAAWTELPLTPTLDTCDSLSEPVAIGPELIIACRGAVSDHATAGATGPAGTANEADRADGADAPDGADGADGASRANVQLYAIDPTTGETREHSRLMLPGDGRVTLIARGAYGHLVALAPELGANGRTHVWAAFADPSGRWSSAQDLASDASLASDGLPVLASRITAAVHRPDTGDVHVIVQERVQGDGPAATAARHVKTLLAVKAEGPLLAALDLEVGTLARADLGTSSDGSVELFEDLHDSLVVWTNPRTGDVREFIAFGDQGFVRFGEVVEENAGPPVVVLAQPVPPIPLATAGVAQVAVGLTAGALSSAMALRMLNTRSSSPAAVEAER